MAFLALLLALSLATPASPPVVARVGINLPTMGIVFWQKGHDWPWTYENYFSPVVMREIKNTLHADYVRTGIVPDWLHGEAVPWRHEDRIMDNACNAGLGVMVIVHLGSDRLGSGDFATTVKAFFARYAAREAGCGIVAEIGNEENLTQTPGSYASIFEQLAPEIRRLGVPVVTAGTSGLDTRWVRDVSRLIEPLPSAYGLHPYNTDPGRMQSLVQSMASQTQKQDPDQIYITEYGASAAATLAGAILALDTQPTITVYEYKCQPDDANCQYGLKDNPPLYAAVQGAFAFVQAHRAAGALSPFRRVNNF